MGHQTGRDAERDQPDRRSTAHDDPVVRFANDFISVVAVTFSA
jgi:hypothetical protein